MAEWVTLCKRTEDPKLAYIEQLLTEMHIPHRRNGESFHAPILEIPADRHDEAYENILMQPVDETVDSAIFDDVPDDDEWFFESGATPHDWVPA